MNLVVDKLDKLWSWFTFDLGIDLGTANTLVWVQGKGIVINEPSAVAQHKKSKRIVAIGREAKLMLGKTPSNLLTIKPLQDGVIADFEVAEAMIKFFIQKVHQSSQIFPPKFPRPKVVIGVPYGITEVEKKAVIDAVKRGGARQVLLIEEPLAAALGVGLPIEEPTGSMIIDIGGGTTEIAVISLGGIVNCRSVRVAGNRFDEAIIEWVRKHYNLLIGEYTAEKTKILIGKAANFVKQNKEMLIRGRDLVSGLPKEIKISSAEVAAAIEEPLQIIIQNIQQAVEDTPPELISDLMQRGIILAGGSSLLPGMNEAIAQATQMPVIRADDPQTAVVRGCAKVLLQPRWQKKILYNI